MPETRQQRFLEGPVHSTLIILSLPMVIGIMSVIAFNLIDTYFIGQLGNLQLAAISYTFPVVFVIGSIAQGIGIGVSSLVSRAIGTGDRKKVQRLATDALTLGFVSVLIFASVGLFTIEPLFKMMGATADVMPYIKTYMEIWYPGVVFLIIPMVGNSAIRATGDTKTPAMIMVGAVLINLILDPILIFGLGPIPSLGILGAAFATLIARAVALLMSLYVMITRERMLSFEIPTLKAGLDSWKRLLYISVPASATNLIVPVSMGIITRFVSAFGDTAVAALGVATRIEAFAMTVLMAMGSVLTPFIGQNFGAKKYERIGQGFYFTIRFSIYWGCFCALCLALFGQKFAGYFSDDPGIVADIVLYLNIVSVSYGLQGILMMSTAGFNALNKPYPAATLTTLRMIILYVPLAYIASQLFGLSGIFAAAALSNLFAAILALMWMGKSLGRLTATPPDSQ